MKCESFWLPPVHIGCWLQPQAWSPHPGPKDRPEDFERALSGMCLAAIEQCPLCAWEKFSSLKICIYIYAFFSFREDGGRRERERNIRGERGSSLGCLLHAPHLSPGGNPTVTSWFMHRSVFNHRATPASRAGRSSLERSSRLAAWPLFARKQEVRPGTAAIHRWAGRGLHLGPLASPGSLRGDIVQAWPAEAQGLKRPDPQGSQPVCLHGGPAL